MAKFSDGNFNDMTTLLSVNIITTGKLLTKWWSVYSLFFAQHVTYLIKFWVTANLKHKYKLII